MGESVGRPDCFGPVAAPLTAITRSKSAAPFAGAPRPVSVAWRAEGVWEPSRCNGRNTAAPDAPASGLHASRGPHVRPSGRGGQELAAEPLPATEHPHVTPLERELAVAGVSEAGSATAAGDRHERVGRAADHRHRAARRGRRRGWKHPLGEDAIGSSRGQRVVRRQTAGCRAAASRWPGGSSRVLRNAFLSSSARRRHGREDARNPGPGERHDQSSETLRSVSGSNRPRAERHRPD